MIEVRGDFKMKITHEEAKDLVNSIKDDDFNCSFTNRLHRFDDYINQQEKKEKLYRRLFNVCKEYKRTSIGLSDDSEFLNVMSKLEEALK